MARLSLPLASFFLSECLIFATSTAALQSLNLPLAALFLTVILTLIVALCLMPKRSEDPTSGGSEPPRWDIPARMVVVTAFVLLLTGIAPTLGPRLTGLLSPFPLYAAILTVFAHHLQGPAPAAGVLRGLLLGLFAFAGFFLVLAGLIERVGIAPAFTGAIMTAFAFQAGSLWFLRRTSG